jgi:hypothetical protein
MTVTEAPTRIPTTAGSVVQFPVAGLLYAQGPADDRGIRRYRRVYLERVVRLDSTYHDATPLVDALSVGQSARVAEAVEVRPYAARDGPPDQLPTAQS